MSCFERMGVYQVISFQVQYPYFEVSSPLHNLFLKNPSSNLDKAILILSAHHAFAANCFCSQDKSSKEVQLRLRY